MKARAPKRTRTPKRGTNKGAPVTFTVHAAKTRLSELLRMVEAGQEVLIAKADKPVAKLVPIETEALPSRVGGTLRGKCWVSPDWDSPELNAEIARDFYESKLFPGNDAGESESVLVAREKEK